MQLKNKYSPISVQALACVFLALLVVESLSAQKNYIRTYIPKVKVALGTTLDENNSLVTTAYYNPAGQLVQTVRHKITPSGKDMADYIVYDSIGRKQREWQSLPFETSDGSYQSAQAFEQSEHSGYFHVDYTYEPSVLNRLTVETGRNTSGKTITTEYLLNMSEVKELAVACFIQSGYTIQKKENYSDGTLSCIKQTNEDGEITCIFKDQRDKVILERHVGRRHTYDTYYLYNQFDMLTCVLPAAVSEAYNSSTSSYTLMDNNCLGQYAYFYEYDYFNNCIATKLPGAGWNYTVYDGDHRPILTQTPNQRSRSEWSFCKYDNMGRTILEGTVRNTQSYQQLVRTYMNLLVCESYDGTGRYGYTNHFSLGEQTRITKATYYDTEDFSSLSLFDNLDVNRPHGVYSSCISLQTGCYMALCGDREGGELSAFCYDKRKRPIGSSTFNTVSRTTTNVTTTYNELDAPIQVNRSYVTPDGTCHSDVAFQYDHSGRESTSTLQVSLTDGSASVIKTFPASEWSYDEFCRPSLHKITPQESVTTLYREDGKLGTIESRNFSQTLHYSEMYTCFGEEYYNGRISATSVRQMDNSYRMYLAYQDRNALRDMMMYSYDGSNYLQFKESVGYDVMGNITTLHRRTPKGDVNVLSFEYDGNHFKSSADYSSSRWPAEYAFLYQPWASQDSFGYDANGNETRNLTQNMEYARYNNQNLPDSICFTGGNTILMDYLSDGRRVRTSSKTYRTALVVPLDDVQVLADPSSVTEEIRDGDLIFRDGHLSELEIPGGYISLRNDTTGKKQIQGYYYIKDYLGSVRLTCAYETGRVLQSLEYLPTGAIFRRTGYDVQNRRFCGKEELAMHGFDMYDSQARLQYTRVPRFSTMDPLAEKYYHLSPYVYSGNDFVNAIDPDGRDYRLVIDFTNSKVIISATYYASTQDLSSAQQAVDYWNNQSGSLTYETEDGNYTIDFALTVVEVETDESMNEEQRRGALTVALNSDKSGVGNTYMVMDQISKDSNKNGKTVIGCSIFVKESQRNAETGAHEIGHSLGLVHSYSGLMTASSTDANRSNHLNLASLRDMISYPVRGKINKEGGIFSGKGSLFHFNTSSTDYSVLRKKGKIRRR